LDNIGTAKRVFCVPRAVYRSGRRKKVAAAPAARSRAAGTSSFCGSDPEQVEAG
jgi:hypothetical protein